MTDPEKRRNPGPCTAAEDGRREHGAQAMETLAGLPEIQASFYAGITEGLSSGKLGAYAADGASPVVVLARYLLNLALCESLYGPLQLCEVGLRNSIHRHLTHLLQREDWFDASDFVLSGWATRQIMDTKDKIARNGKLVTAGRVVAELPFGFWTNLFEAHYEERTRFLPAGIKAVFPHLPKSRHRRKEIKRRLDEIRLLRNRVFHHERIVHWVDLGQKHEAIIEVIGWISPELHEMACSLDRFEVIRQQGLAPWIEKLCTHWRDSTAVESIRASPGGRRAQAEGAD